MNSNTSIPTFGLDNDADGISQWLSIDWVDGRGEQQHRSLKLDHEAHDGGYDHIVRKLREMVQHIWLKGYEAGVQGDQVARFDGYSHGAHPDFPNPYEATDGRHEAFAAGMSQRAADNEAGQRIEGLIGQNVAERETSANLQRDLEHIRGLNENQMRTINTLSSERDEAIEVNTSLDQQLKEAREQRDAVAESIESLAGGTTVPTVWPFAFGATINRADSNFNVTHWVPEGDDGEWTTEYLASQLRGALADAHQAGRAELETDLANAKIVVEQLQNEKERVERDMQARIDNLHHDLGIVRDRLLEEAQERNWCSEYDEFARGVNARTVVFDLHVRSHCYEVTVTVSQDVDYGPVDQAAANEGFSISHDMSIRGELPVVDYSFTLEDVAESEIASKAEQLRRAIYAVSGISSASVSYEEAD